MRILLTILSSLAFLIPRAQTHLPLGGQWGITPWQPYVPYSLMAYDNSNRGWQVRPYASVSAGYLFLGGGISYLSAPVGLVVYHPINNNFSGFAGVTASPTVFNMSRLYTDQLVNPAYPGNRFTGLGVNAGIQGGIIYTNDAKTFSISGSISVQRGSYPIYIPPARTNTGKQQ
jgi:hypothetical protein